MHTSILERILSARRQRVERAMTATPEADLRRKAARCSPVRDFAAALRQLPYGLIAEIKKGSPSRGLLRPDLDVIALARSYERGGASALSVVTEPDFFSGTQDWLPALRETVRCPLLRKDFFFCPWQVWESRALGADAILLILTMVDDRTATELFAAAVEAGLHVLVEVHNEKEAARATGLGAQIVGVNNRNLATFDVALDVSLRLAPHLPLNAIKVSESGIGSAADCRRLCAAGYRAFLVGEALVTSPDPEGLLRTLRGVHAEG